MSSPDRYYHQQEYRTTEPSTSGRYPANHVRFSPWLKPLDWLDALYSKLGKRPFSMRDKLLPEFDRAWSLARHSSSPQALGALRDLLITYCEGVDKNPYLSPAGRFLLGQAMKNSLRNRYRVLKFYHSKRKFIEANGHYRAPLIISGFPRSGTTLLHRLMSQDPNTRAAYMFEFEVPTPPMTAEADAMADPRIKQCESLLSSISACMPGFIETFAESHFWSPCETEESFTYMLTHNGMPLMYNAAAGSEYMDAFFNNLAAKAVLGYEKLFFSMLDAYRPPRSHWLHKAPIYAPFLPTVFEEYPDARVILAHRNPIESLPSFCRLMESWQIAFERDGTFDKHSFARWQQAFMERCILVPFNYRRQHPEREQQIVDCRYEELLAEPIETVRRIYLAYDLAFTPEFVRRMETYLKNNRQGKHGRHRYTLAEYGFTPEGLYRRYQAYMDHYGYRAC